MGGELLLGPFPAPLSAAGFDGAKYHPPLLSRWGKEARRRVAEVAQQVSKSEELNPGCLHLLTPSPPAIFSFHVPLESGVAEGAAEIKVS